MDIEICDKCKGTGIYSDRDERDPLNKPVECDRCFGSGRILTRTYTYKVPFNFDKQLIYEMDKKIIALIRDLERQKYDMNKAKNMFQE